MAKKPKVTAEDSIFPYYYNTIIVTQEALGIDLISKAELYESWSAMTKKQKIYAVSQADTYRIIATAKF